jgi:hypothetical protein
MPNSTYLSRGGRDRPSSYCLLGTRSFHGEQVPAIRLHVSFYRQNSSYSNSAAPRHQPSSTNTGTYTLSSKISNFTLACFAPMRRASPHQTKSLLYSFLIQPIPHHPFPISFQLSASSLIQQHYFLSSIPLKSHPSCSCPLCYHPFQSSTPHTPGYFSHMTHPLSNFIFLWKCAKKAAAFLYSSAMVPVVNGVYN